MNAIILYGLKNCDTCKKARNWLQRNKVEYEFIDYREQRISPEQLKAWAAQVGWEKLINKSGTTWKALLPTRKNPSSDAEWSLLVREHPAIVRRPIVVRAHNDGGGKYDDEKNDFGKNGRDEISVGFNDKLFSTMFKSNS